MSYKMELSYVLFHAELFNIEGIRTVCNNSSFTVCAQTTNHSWMGERATQTSGGSLRLGLQALRHRLASLT